MRIFVPQNATQMTNKKSKELTEKTKLKLSKYVEKQPSFTAAANNIGVSREVLDRATLKGTASPDMVDKIEKFFE